MTEQDTGVTATEVFTVLIGSDVSGKLWTADAIAHEGKLWVVPHWSEAPEQKMRRPTRMIRFDHLRHQEQGAPYAHRYLLDASIPEPVLDGRSTEGFEVLSGADIKVWCPMPSHRLN